MPKIQNTLDKQNLAQFQVWIVDTDPNSRYFQLSQLPDVLTSGKNAFLIAGAPELIATTEVKMEIIDANGNTIFIQPIKNYLEGLSRVVSIEIYEDTPPGPATLTILGHLAVDAQGNRPSAQFVSSYNVKYQKQFVVAPSKLNTTPIRLYQRPSLTVSESLIPFRSAEPGPIDLVNTGSVGLSQVVPVIVAGQAFISTVVQSNGFNFERQMIDGMFAADINGTPYSSSILSLYNNTTAQLMTPFGASIPVGYTTPNYSITYQGPVTYSLTELTRSFADMHLTELTTFSGDVARARMYVRSLDQPGDYSLVTDIPLQPTELTITQSIVTAEQDIEIGAFFSQEIIDDYWNTGAVTVGGTYLVDPVNVATYDSSVLLDSAYITVSTSSIYFGTQGQLTFQQGLEYTFTGSLYGTENFANSGAEIDVYLIGTAFPSTSASPLGQKIASYVVDPGMGARRFDGVSFNFNAVNDGAAYLNFVATSGSWRFNSIEIISANELGFNPDEVTVITPIVGRRYEHLQFKAELYDVNNNLLPILIESPPVFFDGGNYVFKGADHRIEGSMRILPSGSLVTTAISLQATGFTRGSLFMSGSAIVIGSGSFFNQNTPFLVASSNDGRPWISISDKLRGYIDDVTGKFVLQINGDVLIGTGSNVFDIRTLLPHNTSDMFFDRIRANYGDFIEVRGERGVTAGPWDTQYARMGVYTRGSNSVVIQSPVQGNNVSGSLNPFGIGELSVFSSGSIFVPPGQEIYNGLLFLDANINVSDDAIEAGLYLLSFQADVQTNWGTPPDTGSIGEELVTVGSQYVAQVGDYSPDPLVKYAIPVPDNVNGDTILYYLLALRVLAVPQNPLP